LKILLFQLCFVQEKYGPSFWIIQRKREFHLLYKIYSLSTTIESGDLTELCESDIKNLEHIMMYYLNLCNLD
jgi:hypothetical protein